jgi:hypothetical protein
MDRRCRGHDQRPCDGSGWRHQRCLRRSSEDTGEALDLGAGNLTLTFGSAADSSRGRRSTLGLEGRRPDATGRPAAFPWRRPRAGTHRRRPGVQACATIPRWRSMPSGTLPGSGWDDTRALVAAGFRPHLIHLSFSGVPANCFGFRMERATLEPRMLPCSRSMYGPAREPAPVRRGWREEPTLSPGGSGCTSKSGTGRP